MKKILLLVISVVLVSSLTALTFDFDGVLRTRASIYNDLADSIDGHIDNRLRLGMNSELASNLKFRTQLQFGNVTWGDVATGGGMNSGVKISAYELYLDYRMDCINANIRFGQQCWADPMSLINNGSLSGVMFFKDDLFGFKTELGFIKKLEAGNFDDEDNYFLANLSSPNPMFWGILASVYHKGSTNDDSYTVMPYMDLNFEPVQIKAAAFMGVHLNSPEPDRHGFGAAMKAKVDMGAIKVGANVLFATENGIATLFPYYMNGLYIYGIGLYNDSVNLYWNTPYSNNLDTSFSAVGSISVPVMSGCNLFSAAGYLSDQGFEVNMGVEHDIIPKKMKIAGYTAVGIHETTEVTNYVFGTTVVVPF